MNATRLTVIAFAAAAVALTGCSSGSLDATSINTVSSSSSSSSPESPAVESPTADETTPSAEESTEDSSDSSQTQLLAFGQTYTSPDGNWSVSVAEPVRYRKSQYAAGGDGFKSAAKIKVTVKNLSTGKSVDPSTLNVTATSGDREADSIYDNDVAGAPDAVILPGRSVSWSEAFGATPGATFTVQVEDYTDFSSGPVVFDGKFAG